MKLNPLKKAVANALPFDTIVVEKGIYKEGNIVITKSICLIGQRGSHT
jgi:hypothetical protein